MRSSEMFIVETVSRHQLLKEAIIMTVGRKYSNGVVSGTVTEANEYSAVVSLGNCFVRVLSAEFSKWNAV
jgi:hypothetical protein